QGDVIFTHKGTVGRAAIAHADCLLTPQTTYYRVDHTSVFNRYLMWFLESDLFSDQYKNIVKQTTRDFLPITKQYELFHAIPPLSEQRRIVARVDELMGLCDRLEASLATTDDTRRRLLEGLVAEAFSLSLTIDLEAAERRYGSTDGLLVPRLPRAELFGPVRVHGYYPLMRDWRDPR